MLIMMAILGDGDDDYDGNDVRNGVCIFRPVTGHMTPRCMLQQSSSGT